MFSNNIGLFYDVLRTYYELSWFPESIFEMFTILRRTQIDVFLGCSSLEFAFSPKVLGT